MRKGDLDKPKKILKIKEEKCKRLQKEVQMEQISQKKRKEMQAVLAKIAKVNKTATSLQKSLASSRESTPKGSPNREQRNKGNGV